MRRFFTATFSGRMNVAGWASLVALCWLVGSPVLAGGTDEEKLSRLLRKGAELVQEGKHTKAAKAFSEADRLAEGGSAAALIGLAQAANGRGQKVEAIGFASKALALSPAGESTALASAELAIAAAAEATDHRSELATSIAGLRRFLAAEPAGQVSDYVRVRLCHARRELPPDLAAELAPDGVEPVDAESYKGKQLEAPRKIFTPPPFPDDRSRRSLVNKQAVRMASVIDSDGCLSTLEIEQTSSPAWAQAARGTFDTWVFEPARVEGETVAFPYSLSVDFWRR